MTLVWPNGTKAEPSFTSAYGPRAPIHTSAGWTRPYHVGCDWVGIGSLKAIGDGTVVQSSWVDWAGWQVLISLGKIGGVDTWARYCHLASRSPLNVGDRVNRGQTIGTEGATGQVTGKHLHLELYRGGIDRGSGANPGTTTDPRAFIRAHLSDQTPTPSSQEDDMAYLITTDKGDILVVDHNQMTYWNIHEGVNSATVPKRIQWLKDQGAIREVQGHQPASLLNGYRHVGAVSVPSVGTVSVGDEDVSKIAKAVNDDTARRMQS